MSCILNLFKKKETGKNNVPAAVIVANPVELMGPLPDSILELEAYEEKLARRMSYVKRKSNLALENANYAQQKGDKLKVYRYMFEKENYNQEIILLGKRHVEVVAKLIDLSNMPSLELPPAATATATLMNVNNL